MLMPKRVKRRKQMRGRLKGRALRGNKITYGDYGIVAMEPSWITSNRDRGSPYRYDKIYQTWWSGMD